MIVSLLTYIQQGMRDPPGVQIDSEDPREVEKEAVNDVGTGAAVVTDDAEVVTDAVLQKEKSRRNLWTKVKCLLQKPVINLFSQMFCLLISMYGLRTSPFCALH